MPREKARERDMPDLPPLSKNPKRKDNDSEERRGNNYLIEPYEKEIRIFSI